MQDDSIRYSRHEMLEGIGPEGQRRLCGSRVLVLGSGGLGSIVAMYLAGSGVGQLILADYDKVDLSNLQRQLSFSTSDVGRSKAEALAERCRAINPEVEVKALNLKVDADMLRLLLQEVDLVVEGSDSPHTKAMVVEACVEAGVRHVIGGVDRWRGQVMTWLPGYPSWLDVFGRPDQSAPVVPKGILGPLPGIIGSIMASEVVKILASAELPTLAGRLLTYDSLAAIPRVLSVF